MKRNGRATRRGNLALWVSIFVAADLWGVLFVGYSGMLFDHGNGTHLFPDWLDSVGGVFFGVNFLAAVPLILATVVIDIVGGWTGGMNRILSLVGGLLLLTPFVPFLPQLVP